MRHDPSRWRCGSLELAPAADDHRRARSKVCRDCVRGDRSNGTAGGQTAFFEDVLPNSPRRARAHSPTRRHRGDAQLLARLLLQTCDLYNANTGSERPRRTVVLKLRNDLGKMGKSPLTCRYQHWISTLLSVIDSVGMLESASSDHCRRQSAGIMIKGNENTRCPRLAGAEALPACIQLSRAVIAQIPSLPIAVARYTRRGCLDTACGRRTQERTVNESHTIPAVPGSCRGRFSDPGAGAIAFGMGRHQQQRCTSATAGTGGCTHRRSPVPGRPPPDPSS